MFPSLDHHPCADLKKVEPRYNHLEHKEKPWKSDNSNTYPVSNILEEECVEKADNATCIFVGNPCAICICLWCKKTPTCTDPYSAILKNLIGITNTNAERTSSKSQHASVHY